MKKKIEYKSQIALFLASLSILVFGGFSLFQNGGINYTSLVASGSKVYIEIDDSGNIKYKELDDNNILYIKEKF